MLECCPACGHTWIKKRKAKQPKQTDPRVTELVKYYHDVCTTPPVNFNGAAFGLMTKKLLRHYDTSDIQDYISKYLKCGDDFFIQTGYNILLLPNFIQKYNVKKQKKDSVML